MVQKLPWRKNLWYCIRSKKDGKYPLVIYSHGYGYNMSLIDGERLAENGIAVYEFDFCGGSPYSKSDGKSTDMSVLTQAEDLDAVIEKLSGQPFVDNDKIYLSGGSQEAMFPFYPLKETKI